MELEDVIEEYLYHCLAKNYTPKTIINKRQEYKQLLKFLNGMRAITELESVSVHDLKAYMRDKQKAGLQPQSIMTMYKMISAFFNWCVKEEYLTENLMKKVESPRIPKKVLKGFTNNEVRAMIDSFTIRNFIECRNKAIIAMLADCGLRAMEIRSLDYVNYK